MTSWEYRKAEERKIISAIRADPPDMEFIKQRVWLEGGLLSINIRRDAWLLLLGENPYKLLTCPTFMEEYRTNHQIEVDIQRSFVYLSTIIIINRHFEGHDKMDEMTLKTNREMLARIIYSILQEDPSLYYYQGFHDIVEFFLLISRFNVDWTYTIVKSLTTTYIRDYMRSDLSEVQEILLFLYPILEKRAPELCPLLQVPMKCPVIILPWIITLFTHSLSSIYQVARLMDIMLLHPIASIYIAAAILFHFRNELIQGDDPSHIYRVIGRLEEKELPLEKILRDAEFFYSVASPSSLILQREKLDIHLSNDSMILRFEEKMKINRPARNIYQLIKRPFSSFNDANEPTVGLVSLAALGVAIATIIQLSTQG